MWMPVTSLTTSSLRFRTKQLFEDVRILSDYNILRESTLTAKPVAYWDVKVVNQA